MTKINLFLFTKF